MMKLPFLIGDQVVLVEEGRLGTVKQIRIDNLDVSYRVDYWNGKDFERSFHPSSELEMP